MSDDAEDVRCSNCSRPRVPDRTLCRECLIGRRASVVRWRVKQMAAGNCNQCGRPNPDDGLRRRCPACRAKESARYRAKRQDRASAGPTAGPTALPPVVQT